MLHQVEELDGGDLMGSPVSKVPSGKATLSRPHIAMNVVVKSMHSGLNQPGFSTHSGCLTSGRSLNLSELQLSNLKNRGNNSIYHIGWL